MSAVNRRRVFATVAAKVAPITGTVNGRAGPSRVGLGAGQKRRLARTHSDFLNPTDDDRVPTFALNRTAAPHPARAAAALGE
jgi:hypothetical protein